MGDISAPGGVEIDTGHVSQDSASRQHDRGAHLMDGHSVLDPERADPFPVQPREVGTHLEPVSQIPGDGADVGAWAHCGAEGELRRLIPHQLDPVDRHPHASQLDRLTAAGLTIAPLARHPLGRILRRPLQLGAEESGQCFPHGMLRWRGTGLGGAHHAAGEVVGGGADAESSGGQIGLGLSLDEPGQSGCPSNQHHQQPGGEGVKRSGVPGGPDPESAPHLQYHVVRGHTGRLVHQHRADQS
jgi:hypothetical protein